MVNTVLLLLCATSKFYARQSACIIQVRQGPVQRMHHIPVSFTRLFRHVPRLAERFPILCLELCVLQSALICQSDL